MLIPDSSCLSPFGWLAGSVGSPRRQILHALKSQLAINRSGSKDVPRTRSIAAIQIKSCVFEYLVSQPALMRLDVVAKTGGHKQVAPVSFSQVNRFPQSVDIALAQFKGGETKTFQFLRVEVSQQWQVTAAFVDQHLLGRLVEDPAKTAIRHGGEFQQ
jgi:hypothetical protein